MYSSCGKSRMFLERILSSIETQNSLGALGAKNENTWISCSRHEHPNTAKKHPALSYRSVPFLWFCNSQPYVIRNPHNSINEPETLFLCNLHQKETAQLRNQLTKQIRIKLGPLCTFKNFEQYPMLAADIDVWRWRRRKNNTCGHNRSAAHWTHL